jgi:hypothetical protein
MTGLKKEIQALAWPAAAVMAATVLPLVWVALAGRGWPVQAALSTFVLGSAFLVALPFGMELQQRTLSLVLSQPVSRTRIWVEKWGALLAILLVVASVQFIATRGAVPDARVAVRAATFLLAIACSGFLWTLVAGSTIGGAVFSLAGLAILEMVSSFTTSRVTGLELDPFATHPALVMVRIAYAALTAWLGWRLFSRYELKASGEGAGMLPMAALEAVPALRCRSTGALANLVRKELRLQQPTFLLAALFVLCWLSAMLLFRMASWQPRLADVVFTTIFVSYVPLVLVVCGTIATGEDTSLGIRAWHLTLPVSSIAQWTVRLAVMLAAGAVVGFALPLALKVVTPTLVNLPAGTIQLPSAAGLAAVAGVLLVISFWSATLFGHTIKAAVATGVALAALWICVVFATLAGERLGIGSGWMTRLMIAKQWSPEDLLPIGISFRRFDDLAMWTSIAVLAAVALRQSLGAFRAPQIERQRIVRSALQLGLTAAIVSFIPNAYLKSATEQYRSKPVRELQSALQYMSAASLAATGDIPGSVSVADLEATGQLSSDTGRWLAGSRISLQSSARRVTGGREVRYVRTDVSFPSGSAFRMLYTVARRQ